MSMATLGREEPGVGAAFGWSVFPNTHGEWQFSVYGPRGGSMGVAVTEQEAVDKATRALDALRKGWA